MTSRLPVVPTILVAAAIAILVWLGIWQLQRAGEKQALLERYAAVGQLPPISWPTMPITRDERPLFRHATGLCLRVTGRRAVAGQNAAGETGYAHVLDCATGAEGPGMSVEVGWSKDPKAKVNWSGGPVSGVIAPDRRSGMRLVAATAPPGLEPSKVPDVASASAVTPAGHRGYAATWFALALVAFVIYALALRNRWRKDAP